jgi:hypothetical protein
MAEASSNAPSPRSAPPRGEVAAALPGWTASADRLLARAMRETKLLGVATPLDAPAERARLTEAFEAGRPTRPRWSYAPMREAHAVARALEGMASEVERDASPLGLAYATRARELALEASMAGAVGTASLGELARTRFTSPATIARRASELAEAWLQPSGAPGVDAGARASEASHAGDRAAEGCVSDADDPRSLVSRMREEIGRRRLPFNVIAQRSLLPLAATGERTIWVAADRVLSHEEVERTVLHEVLGHARPRALAARQELGLFAIGTAHGSDDQEGYALVLEERHGFLGHARRRELALRHRVVELMDRGAELVDAVLSLVRDHGVTPRRAVATAERAFRGGDGRTPGLGRERVYIASFAAVAARLAEDPEDERVLGAGQVALDALPWIASFYAGA